MGYKKKPIETFWVIVKMSNHFSPSDIEQIFLGSVAKCLPTDARTRKFICDGCKYSTMNQQAHSCEIPVRPFVTLNIDKLIRYLDRNDVFNEFKLRLLNANFDNWEELFSYVQEYGDILNTLLDNKNRKEKVIDFWKEQNPDTANFDMFYFY